MKHAHDSTNLKDKKSENKIIKRANYMTCNIYLTMVLCTKIIIIKIMNHEKIPKKYWV